jgi:hypothetical protein
LVVGRQAQLRTAVIPRMEPGLSQTIRLAGRGRLAADPSATSQLVGGTSVPSGASGVTWMRPLVVWLADRVPGRLRDLLDEVEYERVGPLEGHRWHLPVADARQGLEAE